MPSSAYANEGSSPHITVTSSTPKGKSKAGHHDVMEPKPPSSPRDAKASSNRRSANVKSDNSPVRLSADSKQLRKVKNMSSRESLSPDRSQSPRRGSQSPRRGNQSPRRGRIPSRHVSRDSARMSSRASSRGHRTLRQGANAVIFVEKMR